PSRSRTEASGCARSFPTVGCQNSVRIAGYGRFAGRTPILAPTGDSRLDGFLAEQGRAARPRASSRKRLVERSTPHGCTEAGRALASQPARLGFGGGAGPDPAGGGV